MLCRKIIKRNNKIKVKSYDDIVKSSETINLINFLKKRDKNVEYFFLMGSDNLINLHRWKKWRELSRKCRITVFPRRGYVANSLNSKVFRSLNMDDVLFLKSKMLNISSSKIRKNYLKYKD